MSEPESEELQELIENIKSLSNEHLIYVLNHLFPQEFDESGQILYYTDLYKKDGKIVTGEEMDSEQSEFDDGPDLDEDVYNSGVSLAW